MQDEAWICAKEYFRVNNFSFAWISRNTIERRSRNFPPITLLLANEFLWIPTFLSSFLFSLSDHEFFNQDRLEHFFSFSSTTWQKAFKCVSGRRLFKVQEIYLGLGRFCSLFQSRWPLNQLIAPDIQNKDINSMWQVDMKTLKTFKDSRLPNPAWAQLRLLYRMQHS